MSHNPQNPAYVAWCKQHYALMAEGGVWAVPRSGLIFQKHDGRLDLVQRMPYLPEMAEAAEAGDADVPPSAEALLVYQDEDLATIRDHFEAAGILVADRTNSNA